MHNFCKKCGAKVVEGNKYCKKCGAPLLGQVASQATQTQQQL